MRKCSLTLLLLCNVIVAASQSLQYTSSFQVGIGYRFLKDRDEDIDWSFLNDLEAPALTYGLGFGVLYTTKTRFDYSASLVLEKLGYRSINNLTGSKLQNQFYFLSIPLIIHYRTKFSTKNILEFGVGIKSSILIGDRLSSQDGTNVDEIRRLRVINGSILVSIGFYSNLSRMRYNLFAETSFTRLFIDIPGLKFYLNQVGISVNYLFNK